MYGFPEKSQLKDLLGKEIVQVSLGRRQISLVLETNESISITSTDRFFKDNLRLIISKGDYIPILDNLLSSTIVDVVIDSPRTARLVLDNGSAIILRDDNENYETITFYLEDGIVVV